MMDPIVTELLNIPPYNWRIFGKEYTSGRLGDVSDDNIPATLAVDQIVEKVAVAPLEELQAQSNNSMLKVVDSHLAPESLNFETVKPGIASMTMVTSADDVTVALESVLAVKKPYGITTGYVVSPARTKVSSAQNQMTYPMSIRWNFSDIAGYDGRRIYQVFVRVSAEPETSRMASFDTKNFLTMDFGAGVYHDLFGVNAYELNQWCPLNTHGFLSGKIIMVPVNPVTQQSVRFMFKDCRNWSIELMGYISGA